MLTMSPIGTVNSFTHIFSRPNNLQKNKDMTFTNDSIFELMSGIIGTKTDSCENKYDLCSSEYGISEDKVLTMHGKKLIKDDNREQF